ncbi:MAG: hypothetical protein IIB37_03075 [Gemmatimonadetes bacterium]|nr:hypothetical protein [Gemmatimonadota bacterium]
MLLGLVLQALGDLSPVSIEGGRNPVWAHNGRELIYLAADNSWVVATVRTDPDFSVESRALFASAEGFVLEQPTRLYDISLDDQRLLAVLEDDFDEAASIVLRMGNDGDVSKSSYRDWAIFREFRQSKEFASAFEKVFGEPFQIEERSTIEADSKADAEEPEVAKSDQNGADT